MCFEKHVLNTWYEKHAFYHPLKSLILTYNTPCIKIVFLETYVKRMFWIQYVLQNTSFTYVTSRT